MKPTSKKDWYIVLCENSNETTIVKNKTCNRNEKTWFDYKYVVKSKHHFPEEMLWNHIPKTVKQLPVISFEEWQNLPDEPNDVYSNSEFNSESKIIGYKLIKEEYLDAVNCICKRESREDKNFLLYNKIYLNSDYYSKIKDAEILHWFEPVFEEKKIKLTSGIELTEKDIEEVKEILKNK